MRGPLGWDHVAPTARLVRSQRVAAGATAKVAKAETALKYNYTITVLCYHDTMRSLYYATLCYIMIL